MPTFANQAGQIAEIPDEQVAAYAGLGYRPATPEQLAAAAQKQKYSGAGSMLAAGGEGMLDALTLGLSTTAERGLGAAGVPGLAPEDIAGREAANPVAHGVGTTVGVVAPLLLGDVAGAAGTAAKATAPSLIAKAGSALRTTLLGGEEATKSATLLRKIGSSTLAGAAEGAGYGLGQVIHEDSLGNPEDLGAALLAANGREILDSALLGGAAGFGTSAAGGLLKGAADKYGPRVAPWLEEVEAWANAKERGAIQGDVKRIRARIGPERMGENFRLMRKYGFVGPFMSQDAAGAAADEAMESQGQTIGAMVRQADDAATTGITRNLSEVVPGGRGPITTTVSPAQAEIDRINSGRVMRSVEERVAPGIQPTEETGEREVINVGPQTQGGAEFPGLFEPAANETPFPKAGRLIAQARARIVGSLLDSPATEHLGKRVGDLFDAYERRYARGMTFEDLWREKGKLANLAGLSSRSIDPLENDFADKVNQLRHIFSVELDNGMERVGLDTPAWKEANRHFEVAAMTKEIIQAAENRRYNNLFPLTTVMGGLAGLAGHGIGAGLATGVLAYAAREKGSALIGAAANALREGREALPGEVGPLATGEGVIDRGAISENGLPETGAPVPPELPGAPPENRPGLPRGAPLHEDEIPGGSPQDRIPIPGGSAQRSPSDDDTFRWAKASSNEEDAAWNQRNTDRMNREAAERAAREVATGTAAWTPAQRGQVDANVNIARTVDRVTKQTKEAIEDFLDGKKLPQIVVKPSPEILDHANRIAAIAANPTAMMEHAELATGGWGMHAPKTSAAAATQLQAMFQGLAATAPRAVRGGPLASVTQPSKQQQIEWAQRLEVARDPIAYSMSHPDIVRQINPVLMRSIIVPAVYEAMAHRLGIDKPITYQQAIRLSQVIGSDLTGDLALQQQVAMLAAMSPPPSIGQPPAEHRPHPSAAGKIKLASRMGTLTDRLMGPPK